MIKFMGIFLVCVKLCLAIPNGVLYNDYAYNY